MPCPRNPLPHSRPGPPQLPLPARGIRTPAHDRRAFTTLVVTCA
ncbi:hypothetical protein STTU_4972 [Streptomyces sp. Tu6071]|nr:hypothetical protein STTU_4972 [Streptomyces sp. Tu6071]